MPLIWPASLALEAVLVLICLRQRRKGGFRASGVSGGTAHSLAWFLTFLIYDIATQCVEIASSGAAHGETYRLVHRGSELAAIPLLALATREAYRRMGLNGWAASILIYATVVSLALHVAIARPVAWSEAAGLVWATIALSRLLMGLYLAIAMFAGRRWAWHTALLSAWMIGTAAMFYAAPVLAVGIPLLWMNAGFLVIWIVAVAL